MPPQYRRFATLLPYLQTDEAAGSGTTTTTTTDGDEAKPLGDAGKAALEAERIARRDADKRAKDAEKELADLKSAATKAAEQEQAEQGKWKELAEKREAELTSSTSDREGLKATNEALTAYFDGHFTAALKDLPDVIKAFAPAEDASFATKADWLTKAQAQAAKIAKDTAKPGNGPNPPAADGKFDLQAEVAKAKSRGTYRA